MRILMEYKIYGNQIYIAGHGGDADFMGVV